MEMNIKLCYIKNNWGREHNEQMEIIFNLFRYDCVFCRRCYFMPSQVNVFWTIVVSTMTFLLSFVFIELLEHTKVLKDFDMDQ